MIVRDKAIADMIYPIIAANIPFRIEFDQIYRLYYSQRGNFMMSEKIKPISYLKAHASEIVRKVAENRSTVIITQNGEAKAIIQDIHVYEDMQESLALLKILAGSSNQIKKGEIKKSEEVFENLETRISQYHNEK
jgi:prevent-host-death family protein